LSSQKSDAPVPFPLRSGSGLTLGRVTRVARSRGVSHPGPETRRRGVLSPAAPAATG
jgi:hypothetical protein